jgi:integrase
MPKKSNPLTALAVSKLREEGRHAVGGVDGLYLYIKNGSSSWVLRAQDTHGVRRDFGLGRYHASQSDDKCYTLEQAREAARDLRKRLAAGDDPVTERRAARVNALLARAKERTFAECAHECIEAMRGGWKSAKHAAQWESTLSTYAYPSIGGLPVGAVDLGLVLGLLQQPVAAAGGGSTSLWLGKNETASRLRGRIEKVLDWAAVRQLRKGDNPARWTGNLDTLLPAAGKVRNRQNFPALPYDGIGAFMADLRSRAGISSRALEFVILTATRTGEALGARWKEIDLQARKWTIPAARMKKGREHVVPLADAVVAILTALPRIAGNDLVFPAPRGGALSDMALTSIIRRMHAAAVKAGGRGYTDPRHGDRTVTTHGFRSTFRDWAGETTAYPREVCEHALAHRLADVSEAAYQRGTLLAKRVRLMGDWAGYCALPAGAKGGAVVAIRS